MRLRVRDLRRYRHGRQIVHGESRQFADQFVCLPKTSKVRTDFFQQGRIGSILGELAEIVRAIGVVNELTEEPLVIRRTGHAG